MKMPKLKPWLWFVYGCLGVGALRIWWRHESIHLALLPLLQMMLFHSLAVLLCFVHVFGRLERERKFTGDHGADKALFQAEVKKEMENW